MHWATAPRAVIALQLATLAVALGIGLYFVVNKGRVLDVPGGPCEDNKPCTVNWVNSVYETCTYEDKHRGAACTSPCYLNGTKTTCDARGGCYSADWASCRGYCATEEDSGIWSESQVCDTDAIPIRPYFTAPASQWLDWADTWGSNYCFANQCVKTVLMVTLEAFEFFSDPPWYVFAGGEIECDDLLDNETASVAAGCITNTHYDVDSNFLQKYEQANAGNPTGNFTLRACVFRHACGRFNTSAFYDPQYIDRRRQVTSYVDPASYLAPARNAPQRLGGPQAAEELMPHVMAHVDRSVRRLQDNPWPKGQRVFVV